MKTVLLGIQARSNSQRLRNKIAMEVGEVSIIHRIIYQSLRVAGWFSSHNNIRVKPVLLIPKDDPIKEHVIHKIPVFEGSEDDVLSRYVDAADFYNADYIIRITGDCAWINAQVVSKVLRDAVRKNADYASNILVRTFIEGLDTEIMSRSMLKWLDKNATEPADREHVTTYLCRQIYAEADLPFQIHTVLNSYDLSMIKTSIDTLEEYEQAVSMFDKYQKKKSKAASYGTISI